MNKINILNAIRNSNNSIYDIVSENKSSLWIPTQMLEEILNYGLINLCLKDFPIRTRSKVVKSKICEILGYPVPLRFKKTQPRFPCQNFDTYIQKSNNLQIWNEEISSARRYVIIKINENNIVTKVKVINGDQLAKFDTTGTLTKKYQATCIVSNKTCELISNIDTDRVQNYVSSNARVAKNPIIPALPGNILPIHEIFIKLSELIGKKITYSGADQERNRGNYLQKIICKKLGFTEFNDNGQFPDIPNQLLEIKLQTSPTIDLGICLPNSEEELEHIKIGNNIIIRHCDIRYIIFYGNVTDGIITLTNLIITTGQDFFKRFPMFQGRKINSKIQIKLPESLFYSKPKDE